MNNYRHLVKILLNLAGLIMLLAGAATAQAVPTYAINIQGAGPYAGAGITCYDNTACDLSSTPNVITIMSGVGGLPAMPGFALNLESSNTNSPGGPIDSILHTNWHLVGTTGGSVTITASATGFTFPGAGMMAGFTSSLGGVLTNASVDAQQWVDYGNGLFATAGPSPGAHSTFSGSGSYAENLTSYFLSAVPYSITHQIELFVSAGGNVSGDLQATIPEPGSVILLGMGLLMLTFVTLRRRRPMRSESRT